MPNVPTNASGTYTLQRWLGVFLVTLGGLLCLGHTYKQRHHRFIGLDYRAVYSASRCVIAGCNSYNFEDLRGQFLAHGGSAVDAMSPTYGPFMPYNVGYPPSALFYFVPFALLPYTASLITYLVIGSLLFAVAALLFAYLCSEYVPIAASACLAYFLSAQNDIVFYGQPTLLPAALLCIGLWCLLKNRYIWIGVITFAFSLVFKPQLGGLFLLYFLAAPGHRKRAFQIIAIAALLALPAFFWFSTHAATHNWAQDLKTNIAGITAPGNLSDPGPQNRLENRIINLQTVVSRYRDVPSFYNAVVTTFSAIVIAAWLYPVVRRRPSLEKDSLCLACIAAFSMLPVYHRVYDSRILLILFPALAILIQRTVWWGRAAIVLTLSISYVLSNAYTDATRDVSPLIVHTLAGRSIVQTAVVHLAPLALLTISIFYLVLLYVSPPSLELESPVVPLRIEESVY